ncbi:hypothetical protein ACJ41O_001905 [Fusarium nematophilum]
MEELRNFVPNRRVLEFSRLNEDLPDEFYELHFNKLFMEIYTLVQLAFCPGEGTRAPKVSPWLMEFPEEFINYVQLLARPDSRARKWENLLRDESERSYLLHAIIFKILDTKVFSLLLFGADPEHGKMLQSSDAALIDAEGFRRSNLRAHTNKAYLDAGRGEPALFWEEVDTLCTQTLVLLLPAYTYAAEFKGYEPVPIQDLYQSLHDVIAYAGWLNVLIRLSPAIVSYNWAIPGEPYHMNQVNLCHEAYKSSQTATQQHQAKVRRRRPDSEHRDSAARIKISVTPEIVRHKPVPESVGTLGMTSYTILKPHVVYYEGLELDMHEQQAFVSLPDYIRRLRARKGTPRVPALVIMMIALLSLLVFSTATGRQVLQSAGAWVNPAPKPAKKSLWGMGWF